jgi:hypothetical protein
MKKNIFNVAVTLALLFCITPSAAYAAAWSACETITGVSNYIAYDNTVQVFMTPTIPGCTASTGLNFTVGAGGITSSNINSFLATAMGAQIGGKKVMVYYNSTGCNIEIMAIGGYSGQCN